MPSWTAKDERQYEAVKQSVLDQGRTEEVAKEIAGRTVNKRRRIEGRTPNKTTQGTGNPKTRLQERTVDELRNLASQRDVRGRSRMNKEALVKALSER